MVNSLVAYTIGYCSTAWAKFWTHQTVIDMAIQLNKNIIFEIDSSVNMVTSSTTSNVFFQPLLQEVISLLNNPGWRTQLSYVWQMSVLCVLDINLKYGLT
jgi:hypothetical protein